jgi:hypothetical protein
MFSLAEMIMSVTDWEALTRGNRATIWLVPLPGRAISIVLATAEVPSVNGARVEAQSPTNGFVKDILRSLISTNGFGTTQLKGLMTGSRARLS